MDLLTSFQKTETLVMENFCPIMICNMCGKLFKSQKTLTQHYRDVHFEEDIPCSLCDKTFRTKRHLANHKFNKHTEKEFLQCGVISDDTECSYQTTSVSNLNAHKKRVHEKTVNAIQQVVFKFPVRRVISKQVQSLIWTDIM